MVPSSSISAFVRDNNTEFRSVVYHLAVSLKYPKREIEDLIQDIYLKIMTQNILDKFDPEQAKISTYLYKIIRNFIITKLTSTSFNFLKYRIKCPEPSHDTHFVDLILAYLEPSEDFIRTKFHNDSTDSLTSLRVDLDAFSRRFEPSHYNKRFLLRKTKHKNKPNRYLRVLNRLQRKKRISDGEFYEISDLMEVVEKQGATLHDLFKLIYRGYSSKQVSKIFGVSEVSISTMKSKLGAALVKFEVFQ